MRNAPTIWTMTEVRLRCEEVGDCLIWRGAVNSAGYPSGSVNGKSEMIRRLVYRDILGKDMRTGRRITSRCHNKLCCSDKCLVQLTQRDILRAADARRKAADPMSLRRQQRACTHAKLTPEIADAVLSSNESSIDLARKHGVHPESIRHIRRGESWRAPAIGASSVFNFGASL